MGNSEDGINNGGDCVKGLGGLSEDFYLFEIKMSEADLADFFRAIHTI